MDFDFTDDQESLRDAVRAGSTRASASSAAARIAKAGGFTREAWRELAELGLTGLAVPEAHGGMGFGAVEAMVVMEELGRGLVLAPYAAGRAGRADAAVRAPAALQQRLAAEASPTARRCVVLAQQERALALPPRPRRDHAPSASGGTWQLSGTKSVVPGRRRGRCLHRPGARRRRRRRPGRHRAVPRRTRRPGRRRCAATRRRTARAPPSWCSTGASGIALLPRRRGLAALEHAVDVGIAALCAEAVGVMDKLVALTVEYMNTRKQFGVPIATFQALRHRIADVKMQLELARSMSYFASLKLGERRERAAPRAVAGQGAARPVDALRRPAVHPAARRHRRHRRVRRQPLLQAPDGDRAELRRHAAPPRRGLARACRTPPACSPDARQPLRAAERRGRVGSRPPELRARSPTSPACASATSPTRAGRPAARVVLARQRRGLRRRRARRRARHARDRAARRRSTRSSRCTRCCSPAAAPSASTPPAA